MRETNNPSSTGHTHNTHMKPSGKSGTYGHTHNTHMKPSGKSGKLNNQTSTASTDLWQSPLLRPGGDLGGVGLEHAAILLTVFLVLCPCIALP